MEESVNAPELQGQTTSDLFKIARAVDGDSDFRIRVEMAMEIHGIPATRSSLIFVAKDVVTYIDCTVEGTVNSDRVTDTMIEDSVVKYESTLAT